MHRLPAALLFVAGAAMADPFNAEPFTAGHRSDLMNLLKQDCGSCHGLTMKGGLGPPLLPENLNGKADEMLIRIILDGLPGTPMPPWRFHLEPDEAIWMVKRLKEGLPQ